MAYCDASDLLVGDMPVSAQRAAAFINAASDEIDATLGTTFVVPIDVDSPELDASARLAVKRCAVLLATGRLIMAQAVGAEDLSTHAYGTYLLSEAKLLLQGMADGSVALIGVPRRPEYVSSGNAPSIVYEDSYAPVDSFYGFAMRGEDNKYRPGI